MKGSTEHRGIAYSISGHGNGLWRWKLHPKIAPGKAGALSPISAGQISGTRAECVAAAEKAIDKLLDGAP
jgi:hypothetical protein